MMKKEARNVLSKSRLVVWICVASMGTTLAGCSSTAQTSRIRIAQPRTQAPQDFRFIDARSPESGLYRQDVNIQYLGDSNFEVPPVRLVASGLNEKLGDLLQGKEISLLEFQARVSAPSYQTSGIPFETELLGRALRLPQLGSPQYATISLRGDYLQKEFSGAKSVQFYLGSGESEISEAFEAAVSEAAANLRALLTDGKNLITE